MSSLSIKKKASISLGFIGDDDHKEDDLDKIPGMVSTSLHTVTERASSVAPDTPTNASSPITSCNPTKHWFTLNDKIDVSHDKEWYRAQVTDVDGYSLYVEFQGQNGRICKWIKNCNQIFKYICQCAKECENNIHQIAGFGTQTNYSYDEQIVLTDPNCITFHDIVHSILFKYIGYNIRDATTSLNQFNQDFNLINEKITKCDSMSALLQKYQELNQDLSLSFKTGSKIQQNSRTNAITLGQYIKYIQTCNQSKFKNAIKREHDDIKNMDDTINDTQIQINQLIKQQNELQSRKSDKINTLKKLKSAKNQQKEHIQKLDDEQKQCVENIKDASNTLHRYCSQHKHTLQQIHSEKLKEFEKQYRKWNKQDTIAWIMMIDHQRFLSNHKYSKFRKMLNKSRINGESLNDLKSDLFLKYVGLGIESRTALINNINRVLNDMTQNEDQ